MMRSFREYQPNERRNYITLSTGEYYPDILVDACKLYSPVLYVVRSTRYLRIPSSAGNSTGALVLVLVNLLSAAIIIPYFE